MKKILLTSAALLALTNCFSQDTITKRTGEELTSKVLEVGQSEIKYKKFDNIDGPTFSIAKSDVLMVQYENGTKDIFDKPQKNSETSEQLASKGTMDASKSYKGYKSAGTGTLVVALISPLVGLIPALTCSLTPPKDKNLMFPNAELKKEPEYYNSYTKKAKRIKSGKVWTNWGIALGVNIVLSAILVSSSSNSSK